MSIFNTCSGEPSRTSNGSGEDHSQVSVACLLATTARSGEFQDQQSWGVGSVRWSCGRQVFSTTADRCGADREGHDDEIPGAVVRDLPGADVSHHGRVATIHLEPRSAALSAFYERTVPG